MTKEFLSPNDENGLFYGPESGTKLEIEGFAPGSEEDKRSRFDQVGPGYFSNVGIPLLLGRDFTERDNATAPRVAVINETMAKFYFGGGNPIGKHITTRIEDKPLQLEIVGVARDAQDHNFWSKPMRRFCPTGFRQLFPSAGCGSLFRPRLLAGRRSRRGSQPAGHPQLCVLAESLRG